MNRLRCDECGTHEIHRFNKSYQISGLCNACLWESDWFAAMADGMTLADLPPLPGSLGETRELLRNRTNDLWWPIRAVFLRKLAKIDRTLEANRNAAIDRFRRS